MGRDGDRDGVDVTTDKRMRLRYAGTCRVCGAAIAAGAPAVYERATRTVRCLECAEPAAAAGHADDGSAAPIESGTAGASARREYERRRTTREERVRTNHPKLAGVLLTVFPDPQSTQAWATGAEGEEHLGARLDALVSPTVRVLHDRRIPRTRANIDHLVVCPSGVFVVDAKKYQGRPHLRVDGGLLRPRTQSLMVGSRNATTLVDGVHKQVALVRAALDNPALDDPALDNPALAAAVRGVLCFVKADWPLIGGSFTIRDIDVLWPKKLAGLIGEPGPLAPDRVAAVHERLARAFPVA